MSLAQRLIDRIVADEPAVTFQADDPFTHSYFEFLRYFRDLSQINRHHVIISANFVYGWMPTMLRFGSTQFEQAAAILNRVKHSQEMNDDDLSFLINLINRSLVGVSKLLHFVNPEQYAILDSRVSSYLHLNPSSLNEPRTYRDYLRECREVIEQPEFKQVHNSINRKIGQPVTALRALELVMHTMGSP